MTSYVQSTPHELLYNLLICNSLLGPLVIYHNK